MKKILLGLGSLTAIVAPVAAVVACGTEQSQWDMQYKSYDDVILSPDKTTKVITTDEYNELTKELKATEKIAGLDSVMKKVLSVTVPKSHDPEMSIPTKNDFVVTLTSNGHSFLVKGNSVTFRDFTISPKRNTVLISEKDKTISDKTTELLEQTITQKDATTKVAVTVRHADPTSDVVLSDETGDYVVKQADFNTSSTIDINVNAFIGHNVFKTIDLSDETSKYDKDQIKSFITTVSASLTKNADDAIAALKALKNPGVDQKKDLDEAKANKIIADTFSKALIATFK